MNQIVKEPRSNKPKKKRNQGAIDQIFGEPRSKKPKKPRKQGAMDQIVK